MGCGGEVRRKRKKGRRKGEMTRSDGNSEGHNEKEYTKSECQFVSKVSLIKAMMIMYLHS